MFASELNLNMVKNESEKLWAFEGGGFSDESVLLRSRNLNLKIPSMSYR